eukprot:2873962-Pleurochrysis_carterae.AAC.1
MQQTSAQPCGDNSWGRYRERAACWAFSSRTCQRPCGAGVHGRDRMSQVDHAVVQTVAHPSLADAAKREQTCSSISISCERERICEVAGNNGNEHRKGETRLEGKRRCRNRDQSWQAGLNLGCDDQETASISKAAVKLKEGAALSGDFYTTRVNKARLGMRYEPVWQVRPL